MRFHWPAFEGSSGSVIHCKFACEGKNILLTENWYLKNKSRIILEIKFAIPHYRTFIVEAYGKELAEVVAADYDPTFRSLIATDPNIGGSENLRTENLYLSAAMLAMYKSLT